MVKVNLTQGSIPPVVCFPRTPTEEVIHRLYKNEGSLISRIALAVRSVISAKLGSAQHLAAATKELLKNPTDQAKLEIFYTSFSTRVSKIGFDVHSADGQMVNACIHAAIAKKGGKVTQLPELQQMVLQKVAVLEAQFFVRELQTESRPVNQVESAIQAKSKQLAAIDGSFTVGAGLSVTQENKKYEKMIKEAIFASFESGLLSAQKISPDSKVVESRIAAAKEELKACEKTKTALETALLGLEASFLLAQPALKQKIKEAQGNFNTASLQLNLFIADFRASLAALIEKGEKEQIDCSGLVSLLERLDSHNSDSSYQSLRELIGALSVLSKFLNSKDVKKLGADRFVLDIQAKQLQSFIDVTYTKARGDLQEAKTALEVAEAKVTVKQEELEKIEAKIAELTTLLEEQASVDAWATYNSEVEAYEDGLIWAGFSSTETVPQPSKSKPTTVNAGGITAKVAQEFAQVRSDATALYNYLRPEAVQSQRRWFSRG